MQFNTFQTGNPMSGGWRYPYGGATSNDALNYRPMGIDSEFLKQVANLGKKDEAKGLLEQMVAPTPLDAPLSGSTGYEPGNGMSSGSSGRGVTAADAAPGQMVEASPGGYAINPGAAGQAALAMMSGSPIGAAAALARGTSRVAPVFDAIPVPVAQVGSLNNPADQNFGSSPNAMGPPDAAQANALADALAAALAGYASSDNGGLAGDSNLGSAGNAGMDGAGGIGSW